MKRLSCCCECCGCSCSPGLGQSWSCVPEAGCEVASQLGRYRDRADACWSFPAVLGPILNPGCLELTEGGRSPGNIARKVPVPRSILHVTQPVPGQQPTPSLYCKILNDLCSSPPGSEWAMICSPMSQNTRIGPVTNPFWVPKRTHPSPCRWNLWDLKIMFLLQLEFSFLLLERKSGIRKPISMLERSLLADVFLVYFVIKGTVSLIVPVIKNLWVLQKWLCLSESSGWEAELLDVSGESGECVCCPEGFHRGQFKGF